MQKKITESKMSLALVGTALILSGLGCSKQEAKKRQPAPTGVVAPADGPAPAPAPAPAPIDAPAPAPVVAPVPAPVQVVVNATTSQVVKSSDNKYMVLPPAQEVSLSLANEPIKSSCKAISKMNHEAAAINLSILKLEAEKTEIKLLMAQENAYDHDIVQWQKQEEELQAKIDAVQASLNEKEELMKKAKSETFEMRIELKKSQLLKNIETLKAANAGLVFEIKSPTKTVIKAKTPNGETRAEQSQPINLIEGAFDESTASTKVKVNINFDILCTVRTLNSAALTSGSKSYIEMSFAE